MVIAFAITGLQLILCTSRLTGKAFGKYVQRTGCSLMFSALIQNNISPFNSSEYEYQMYKSFHLLLNLNFVSANYYVHALISNLFCWPVSEISCLALLIFSFKWPLLVPIILTIIFQLKSRRFHFSIYNVPCSHLWSAFNYEVCILMRILTAILPLQNVNFPLYHSIMCRK
jgi:hypothetical protein